MKKIIFGWISIKKKNKNLILNDYNLKKMHEVLYSTLCRYNINNGIGQPTAIAMNVQYRSSWKNKKSFKPYMLKIQNVITSYNYRNKTNTTPKFKIATIFWNFLKITI